VLDSDPGDETVDRGTDGDTRAATVEVHARSFPVAFYRIYGMIKGLGTEVLRHPLELTLRENTLDDLLVDRTGQAYRQAEFQCFRETLDDFCVPPAQVTYPDRGIYQVQFQVPSRSFL
jgi:hypothetical protein